MIQMAALLAASTLGLAQPPSIGIACVGLPNLTTCGRIGIAVWLKHPARGAHAELDGASVRMHAGGFGGTGPTYWEGYVHIDRHRLRLPRQWFGDKPTRLLTLRLSITYRNRTGTGAVRVQLRPGWG